MKRTEEYLLHARECRDLAKQMQSGEQRDQLLKMAETWEVLAEERRRALITRGEEDTLADGTPDPSSRPSRIG